MAEGFFNKLRLANIFSGSGMEPGTSSLFGNLIQPPIQPRQIEPESSGFKIIRDMPLQRGGIDSVANGMLNPNANYNNKPMDVVYDRAPELAVKKDKFDRAQMASREKLASIIAQNKTNIDYSKLDIQQQRADIASGELTRKEIEGRAREETSRKRADSYTAFNNFKMDNPDWDIVKQEGGNYILINPKTGESKDSQIPTGTMSKIDEINLRIKGQMDVARVPRTVISSGTSTTGGSGVLPSQLQSADYLAAQQIFNENPEWQDYIELGDPDSNRFTIDPPGKEGWLWDRQISQTEIAKRKLITDAIRKRAVEIAQKSGGTRTTESTRQSTSSRGAVPTTSPSPITSKIGDERTAPNGNKLRFDGKGWELVP